MSTCDSSETPSLRHFGRLRHFDAMHRLYIAVMTRFMHPTHTDAMHIVYTRRNQSVGRVARRSASPDDSHATTSAHYDTCPQFLLYSVRHSPAHSLVVITTRTHTLDLRLHRIHIRTLFRIQFDLFRKHSERLNIRPE